MALKIWGLQWQDMTAAIHSISDMSVIENKGGPLHVPLTLGEVPNNPLPTKNPIECAISLYRAHAYGTYQ